MIKEVDSRETWDQLVQDQAGHPLQLWAWGEVKSAAGRWRAHRLWLDDLGGAQVLVRRLPWPFRKLAYIPRGPVVNREENREKVLAALSQWAKKAGCLELKIEPNWRGRAGLKGWKKSPSPSLLAHTLQVDLQDEPMADQLLKMDSKTRQNIRRSLRYGVSLQQASRAELAEVLEIYHATAKRAGFNLHPDRYYYDIWDHFGEDCRVYLARREGRTVSFVWLVATEETAFELYGGMGEEGKKYRANYALKYLAMQAEQARGVRYYDMNGLLSGGVSDFKRGFAPTPTDWVGAYDRPFSPLYGLWERLLPFGIKIIHLLKR